MDSSRRNFIKQATASGAAILAAPSVFGSAAASKLQKATDATAPFKLKYAPSFGMFREHARLSIVLEPFNTLRNHPGLFLTGIPRMR
jgi:hypothetical protein